MNEYKLSPEDALFIARKSAEVAPSEPPTEEVTFSYAEDDEVAQASSLVIELYQPTLKELKNR